MMQHFITVCEVTHCFFTSMTTVPYKGIMIVLCEATQGNDDDEVIGRKLCYVAIVASEAMWSL